LLINWIISYATITSNLIKLVVSKTYYQFYDDVSLAVTLDAWS